MRCAVAQNFLPGDRDQELLAPSLREWLPADHLAWFVLEAVDEIDLSDFYGDFAWTAGGAPPSTRG